MTENKPITRELSFTESTREDFLDKCQSDAVKLISANAVEHPEQIKVSMSKEDIRETQRKGLDFYENITWLQEHKIKRLYPPLIDVVHIYSGPFTALYRGMEREEGTDEWVNYNRSRDNDRDDAGLALVREIARSRLREGKFEKNAQKLTPDTPEEYFPCLVYNGQPSKLQNGKELHENKDFRTYMEYAADRGLISRKYLQNKVYVFDRVENTEGETVNIVHTGHQVRNFVQEITRPDGALHDLYESALEDGGALNVAFVSHNSGIIRIPFYFGLWKDALTDESGRLTLNLFPFGVRDRSGETAEKILRDELSRLALYAVQGSLSPTPYPYQIGAKLKD